MKPENARPAERGFRMPAEWQPHRATWVAWPHNGETWPDDLQAAQSEFVHLVEAIAQGEIVCVIASGSALEEARKKLRGIRSVEFFDVPTNDAWIRDYGPTFVTNPTSGQLAAVAWSYNGWGEKYPPFDQDQQAARRIARKLGIPLFVSSQVIEGGAIEINDRRELITTQSCLLNPNRIGTGVDSAMARQSLEDELRQFCGAERIIWLTGAEIEGDDTDGHIDQQVRFVNDRQLVIARSPLAPTLQSRMLARNREELVGQLGSLHSELRITTIDLPSPIEKNRTLPASYVNFYICNAGVMVPQFGDVDADRRAVEVLSELFQDRPIIALASRHLAYGLGSFHCLTQQEPRAGQ